MASRSPSGAYVVSGPRVAAALLVGAVSGAFLVTAQWLGLHLRLLGLAGVQGVYFQGAEVVFIGSLVTWLVGLILIGGPAWWLLYRRGRRGWGAAIAAGMALTFIVSMLASLPIPTGNAQYSAADPGGMIVANNVLTIHGWMEAGLRAFLLAFVGGAVAWMVWRTAYRRAAPTAAVVAGGAGS